MQVRFVFSLRMQPPTNIQKKLPKLLEFPESIRRFLDVWLRDSSVYLPDDCYIIIEICPSKWCICEWFRWFPIAISAFWQLWKEFGQVNCETSMTFLGGVNDDSSWRLENDIAEDYFNCILRSKKRFLRSKMLPELYT